MAGDMVFEDVPRLRRRVGDNMLASSNNSVVLLGRDRLGSIDSGYGNGPGAGAIHMMVGRRGEDPSPDQDAATLYLSARTDPDSMAGTDSIGQVQKASSAIVFRADCIRASARTDLKVSVGRAYLLVSSDGQVVIEGDVSLGQGAAERIIRGDAFRPFWNGHTHATPMGLSGPPTQPMTDALLSSRNRVK